jgi:C-terminal processing protease CtpA/Prc
LLTVPSFAGEYRQPLLKLIAQHREQLRAHTDWIIDVRGNDGGADDTYYPLLSWLMPDELEDIGAEWLATPANIEGERQRCALYAPGDKDCERASAEALSRMQSVATGSYVQQEDGPAIRNARVEHVEPRRPARVAILMDSRCASSCEEFLLTVRQSFAVKLIGQPSRGSLDYSNLRPHDLPSGERVLRYAISRSERLPDLPVDPAGVQPDIYMPEPSTADARHDEEVQVRHWLESGSFAAKIQ